MSSGRKNVESAAGSAKPINYSKWDNLEDSDDEKEKVAAKAKAASKPAADKMHCFNCHEDNITKVFRCGTCKAATYCSQKCQKDDWSFHKRGCKKPEPPKAKPPERPAERQATNGGYASKPKKEEKVIDDSDEKIDWYRHREWKPQEAKAEFTPQRVDSSAPQQLKEAPAVGSAWNAAGTWEEKDTSDWSKRTLKEQLLKTGTVDAAGGVLEVSGIEAVDGDSSIGAIRGKVRYIFDLSFKVKFTFKRMGSSGQESSEGSIKVADFTNDAFSGDSDPVVEVSFNDRALDAGRKAALQEALGTSNWPARSGTLMGNIADSLKAWQEEFMKLS